MKKLVVYTTHVKVSILLVVSREDTTLEI